MAERSHSKVGGIINRNVVAHRPNRLQQNDESDPTYSICMAISA